MTREQIRRAVAALEADTPSERLARVLRRVAAHVEYLRQEHVGLLELARAEQLLRNCLFEAGEED